jgi:hypothetical protein
MGSRFATMVDRLEKCASRERSTTSRSREWRERDDGDAKLLASATE